MQILIFVNSFKEFRTKNMESFSEVTCLDLDKHLFFMGIKSIIDSCVSSYLYFSTCNPAKVAFLGSFEKDFTVFFIGPSDGFPISCLFKFESSSAWTVEDTDFPKLTGSEQFLLDLRLKVWE